MCRCARAPTQQINTFVRTPHRCTDRGYRDRIAECCFEHVVAAGDLNLLLYDVTTFYFEAEKEYDLFRLLAASVPCGTSTDVD
ncbi:hypothetical protein CQZ88_06540 [Rhodococcus sp. ENV425]|nr:hypothetical protein BKE56_008065 [Rhodococcus sp. M8]PND52829.1 hypothetical protein CQZ88_06540 [Rhodococcus sp. ENV425]